MMPKLFAKIELVNSLEKRVISVMPMVMVSTNVFEILTAPLRLLLNLVSSLALQEVNADVVTLMKSALVHFP